MLQSSQSTSVERNFHVSWHEAPANLKGYVLNWVGPGQALATVPPKVTPTKDDQDVVSVKIDFRDVKAAGVYSGQIVLQGADDGSKTMTFDLTFVATFKPSVIIRPAGDISLKASNCNYKPSCWLSTVFSPETKALQYALIIKNTSPDKVDLRVQFAALGATSKPLAISLSTDIKSKEEDVESKNESPELEIKDISPGETKTIYATVANPNMLSAGMYSGPLRFSATPSSTRKVSEGLVGKSVNDDSYEIQNVWQQEVTSTVMVKSSVVWAMLVLLVGLAVGRVAATISTEGFEQKLKYFPVYQKLRSAILNFPEAFRSTIDLYIIDAWNVILSGGKATVGEQKFVTLEKQVAFATVFFSFVERIELLHGDEKKKDASERLNAALQELEKVDPNFEIVIGMKRELLRILNEDQQPGSTVWSGTLEDLEPLSSNFEAPSRFARALALVAGTGTAGVGLYYRYLRPLMYIVVVFMLVIFGLWENYSSGAEAATFGAQPISQYVALFLWGITADIVNKSLQQLSLKEFSFKRP